MKLGPLPVIHVHFPSLHIFSSLLFYCSQQKLPVELCANERQLLSLLTTKIQALDPDVLVGHGMQGHMLDVLLHRLHVNKISVCILVLTVL